MNNSAHKTYKTLKRYLSFLRGIAKGVGWFVSDVKFKYIYASQSQCSSCFGKLTKKPYGGFDYNGKTFYICRDCYDNLHNKN